MLILILPFIGFSQMADSLDTNRIKALELYRKAEVYKQGSDIQLALYDSAIHYNPYNAEFYFKKSIWYKKSGHFTKSFTILNNAVALDPVNYLGYRAWSKLYFLRDFKGCLADLRDLDSLTPDFVDYPWGENMFYLKGLCHMGLSNYEQAIDAFNTAFSQDGDYYSLHYKGLCLFELGEFERSFQAFQKCVQIHDKLPDTYYYLSLCHQREGNSEEAIKAVNDCNSLYNNGYRFSLPFVQPFKTIYQADIDALKSSM